MKIEQNILTTVGADEKYVITHKPWENSEHIYTTYTTCGAIIM